MVVALSKLHNVSYSNRYWRVVLGIWLSDFIRLTYGYYVTIQNIDKSNLVTNTYIIYPIEGSVTPQIFSEFHEFYSHQFYNHYLLSSIIKETPNIPYEEFSIRNVKILQISPYFCHRIFIF